MALRLLMFLDMKKPTKQTAPKQAPIKALTEKQLEVIVGGYIPSQPTGNGGD